ncbi:potassium uptake TrkH family protein [Microbacterium halimionae]|uniref:Potassium uptake TrkH family protein n=1 Tax=Microbacterium halimionae TaxID=1526413 RepID=A0A7W3JR91_9MICO|nr:potassium transporter TrkG [Microbacterium halimionae]MBA8817428.1 potassium uptake TrkH family protein [Microbacterium halimionae]NII96062.1 potassium uptake TrkH family protein [Microbacterium halimionae]
MSFRSSPSRQRRTARHQRFRLHPAQAVVVGFALTIAAGTALLVLPIAKAGPGGANFVEALFTATSAVCVTGLTVVDTAVFWSPFGQVVIMLLIQLGGLGIMIFASLIGLVIARKLSVRSRLNTVTEAKQIGFDDVRGLVRGIVKISLLIEAAVFLMLLLRFTLGYGYTFGEGVWFGLFHAVSSFNNAGFALYSDSLMGFVDDPFICLPLCAAIILGGLGFPVIMQLKKEFRKPLHWSMNTKIVLWGTGVLLVGGWAYITALEWNNPDTFGPLTPWGKILAGFFHSVQTRTAGFNSVDIGMMHDETWLGMDVLMFIGAGPAGTGGGIKVTTFAVLFFIMVTELRGEGAVNIFGKRLSRAVHRQAITVVLIAVGAVVAGAALLMVISGEPMDQSLFETVSAFATVGLSTGITNEISTFGQIVLIVLMFLGRLGPLTLGSAIALRERHILYELPKERPAIG